MKLPNANSSSDVHLCNSLEENIIHLARKKGVALAVAESCTGGLVSHRLTNIPGASAVFLSGWVVYSNEAKIRELGILSQTIEKNGAVSQEVAEEMAYGALIKSNATLAVSLTGIAGPGGAMEGKPVGVVYIGLSMRSKNGNISKEGDIRTSSQKHLLCSTDRLIFKQEAADMALNWILNSLDGMA